MEHRRADRRYDRSLPIDVSFEAQTFTATTRNVSLGGVFIDTDQTLPFAAHVTLKFQIPNQAEAVEVGGEVRWIERDEGQICGIGIRFDGLRARDVWALNKFFEKPET